MDQYTGKHVEVAAILTDINLSTKDGIKAIAEIREFERTQNLPEVPIIVLTGDSKTAENSLAMETGANEIMGKPMNRLELAHNLVILLQDAHTILIVNEDQYQLSSYRHIASSEGYKVVAKSNPADAIRFIWNAKALSAVLVDYNLTAMTC
jgi:CheY-like chemotaxis protein